MGHLEGRTYLVTGGSRGIGAAIVEALAKDGARVVIHCGRDMAKAEELLARIGGQGFALQADFTNALEPTRLFAEAVRVAGRIHGVVNNAGIRSQVDIASDLATWHDVWAREMQVNFQSAADLCRAALGHYREHGGGHIITMASRAGQRGYMGDALPYGATKAALINLSKSIARSFGHEGVVSIAVAPGWVRTEMAEDYVATHGLKAAVADIPIGRMAEPSEVGELVAFAMRPSQASLNGATLDVNGGSYIR